MSYLNSLGNKLSSGILEEMAVISSQSHFVKDMLTCTAFSEVQPRISIHGRTRGGGGGRQVLSTIHSIVIWKLTEQVRTEDCSLPKTG